MTMATGAIVPGAIEACRAEYWVGEKLFHGGLRRKPHPSREGRGQDGTLQFRRPGIPPHKSGEQEPTGLIDTESSVRGRPAHTSPD